MAFIRVIKGQFCRKFSNIGQKELPFPIMIITMILISDPMRDPSNESI